MSIRSLGDILTSSDDKEELYSTEQNKKNRRKKKGLYSRSDSTFDFLYLVKNWDKIVGKMLSENTIPLKVRNSSLIVMTKHSIFSQELSFMSQQIIDKIENLYPKFKGHIKSIKFSHGKFSSEEFNTVKKKISPTSKPTSHKFDPKTQQKRLKAKEMFNDVEDEEIRELLETLYVLKD
jgi:hypothetical protein